VLYNNLSGYLKGKYGKRLKKICIDGGFTCPNRDGSCGVGGCIFCGERGAGEHIARNSSADIIESITAQVRAGLEGAADDEGFIVYFQNFTNTYAAPEELKRRYDAALIDERIKVLDIGTRPDCINEEIASLIASYLTRAEVWVEFGLQTASDKTAEIINRGYRKEVFSEAAALLEKYKIPMVVHLMLGLPSEGDEELRETVEFISRHKLFGIKLHSVYVMEGTRLAEMYKSGLYTPITEEDYVARAAYVLKNIPSEVVIHRLTGDCPRDMLLAPLWSADKNRVIEKIRAALATGLRHLGVTE
jgi:radical SAM protein (TIGR01212 family)